MKLFPQDSKLQDKMKLKAFTSYLMVQILPSFSFNLDKLNLAHSKITSIEHITMNPTEEQYMEYYADYDFPSEDYDHIGDIGDLDLIFPTLGRDELNLSIGPMALSVAEVGDFTREYGTYIGDIKVRLARLEGLHLIVLCRLTLTRYEATSTLWTRTTSTSESSATTGAALWTPTSG